MVGRNRMTKFNPPRSQYKHSCIVDYCDQVEVKCNSILNDGQPCNQYGHPAYYKVDEINIALYVKHAHFLSNIDTGRNVFHRISEPFRCPPELKKKTWVLKQNFDRYERMPEEVKQQLMRLEEDKYNDKT